MMIKLYGSFSTSGITKGEHEGIWKRVDRSSQFNIHNAAPKLYENFHSLNLLYILIFTSFVKIAFLCEYLLPPILWHQREVNLANLNC